MKSEELERYVLNDGLRELDIRIARLKEQLNNDRWSEAYVEAGDLLRTMRGVRKTVERLEQLKKGLR